MVHCTTNYLASTCSPLIVATRKVAFVLEELGLTYESIYIDLQGGEHKQPTFTKYNPNGRIPAIVDHKYSDFILWYALIHIFATGFVL